MNVETFSIAQLRLRAGDRLVVKVHGHISQEVAQRLKEQVQDSLPEGVVALVIDQNIDFSILTVEEMEKLVVRAA